MVEHIKAQPVQKPSRKTSNRELWATVCYYYPQYSLQEASKLPLRDIKLLLRVAEKCEAKRFHELTQIVASPHTKKGAGVKQLTEHYKKIMQ